MSAHHGEIIEKIIRKNGHSISDIARQSNVNRRSVYNWFSQERLKTTIIIKIGHVINYDFSAEFPHLTLSYKYAEKQQNFVVPNQTAEEILELQETEKWRNKYLDLLEVYTQLSNAGLS
jgi:AcrR family transcriptional regulator